MKKLLKLKELAEVLNVHEQTIYKWLREDPNFPAETRNPNRFVLEDVIKYLKEKK